MNNKQPRSKNKWNSQRISKRFKNRHLNDEYRDKCLVPKTNVNSYIKHWGDESTIDSTLDDANQIAPSSWTCEQCTFYNIDYHSYCAICELPFNENDTVRTHRNIPHDMTMAHYLNPILSQIDTKHDDLDQSLQFAIQRSLQHTSDSDDTDSLDDTSSNYTTNTTDTTGTDRSECSHTSASVIHNNKKRRTKTQSISFAAYWQELSQYNALLQKNIKYIKKQNKLRAEQDKKESKTLWAGHGHINSKAYELIQHRPALMGAIPSINVVYGWLGARWDVKEFKIRNVIHYSVLQKFVAHGALKRQQLQIVFHGTRSNNDGSIINRGLVVGGTKGVPISHGRAYGTGVYCSPNLSTASGYQRGSLFICLVRSHRCTKSGTIYVVPNDDDILPLYLASFSYSGCEFIANNSIFTFQPGWKPLNANAKAKKERKIKRKWSAYHKLIK